MMLNGAFADLTRRDQQQRFNARKRTLKRCGLIVNDNATWSEMGTVEFHRDRDDPRTEITLEDVEDAT